MDAYSRGRGSLFLRFDRIVCRFEEAFIGLSILIMAINTVANVLGRYVFSHSLYFSEELNEILMVTVTFVGLGYITRSGQHIRMSALYDMVPEAKRRWLMILIALTTAVAMFFLASQAWDYVAKVAARGRLTPSMQLPLWTTYVSVVIGLVLSGLQFVYAAWANIVRREGVWISYGETDEYQDPEISELIDQGGVDGRTDSDKLVEG